MAYKKIELVEPIYELQEKETPRQHYFVDLYYEVDDDNLTKFIKSFDGLKKGAMWVYSGCKEELCFNPPKSTTMREILRCLQAKKRRNAYWKNKINSKREKRNRKGELFLDTFQDTLQEELESNQRISNEIESDDRVFPHLKGKGKNEISQSYKNIWEIYKEITGVEVANTEQNINLNLDADVTQQTTAEVKMQKLKELQERMEQMTYD